MISVHQISIGNNMKTSELLSEMLKCGVMGSGRLGRAFDIIKKMKSDKDCKVFLGIAGAMVPGGMRNIIIDMLESGFIDVIVTTGATLTHDLVEALGYSHLKGSSEDSDEKLHEQGMDRIFDSLMPNKVYEGMEEFFKKHFEEFSKETKIKDFLWKIGSKLKEKSILKVCFDKKIPLFCPAIADSGIGLMMWGRIAGGKNCSIKAFDDMDDIIKIAWDSKKSGVIYVCGGVPKNFIQQSMQFSKGAFYGIQISTDVPHYGGSSGAPLKEGISWGKLDPNGEYVDVYLDATIALPLLWSGTK